jgi:transposase
MKRQKGQKTRGIGSLSWAEREEMIKEYLTGNFSKVEIWKKYTGQSVEHGKMLHWMRMLGYSEKIENPIKRHLSSGFIRQEQSILATKDNPQDPRDLQKRIKELERQLENAQLKAEGYELMIEIAEKELKIPIRKKSDTK